MEQPLNKIKRLSKSLPENDIQYADKFINNREFDKLLELVESDIFLVERNETLEIPKEKYKDIDLHDLIKLKMAIEEYRSFIEVPNSDNWIYD